MRVDGNDPSFGNNLFPKCWIKLLVGCRKLESHQIKLFTIQWALIAAV